MVQRKPVAILDAGLGELPPADTLPVPAYGVGGVIASCRLWIGEATTDASGAWSVDLTRAGFTAPPKVIPQALSVGTAVAASATAIVAARSATAASGYVNLPATVVLGGLGDSRAGAGLTVMVLAIGP